MNSAINGVRTELNDLERRLDTRIDRVEHLAGERSGDGEMDRWPVGPEFILELLEGVQETLEQISCTGGGESGSADTTGDSL